MTVDFTHGYQPPGVYVEEEPSALVSVTGLPPTLVAIVGPSIGYRRASQEVALSETAARLTHRGIDQASIVVTRVDTGEAVDPADWTTNVVGSLASRDYFLDFVRQGSATTEDGTLVFVSYQYTEPEFFVPRRFDNFEDVKDAFGEPLNLSTEGTNDPGYQAVLSPLSLAAKIAFENGAGELFLCATTPPPSSASTDSARSTALRDALVDAYKKVATNYSISLVVPLTDGILEADAGSVGTGLLNHVETASRDGYFRTGILGFDPTVTTAPDSLLESGGFRSRRIVLAYASPSGMAYYNGAANKTVSLGHQYLAAAYAGRLSSRPVQNGLTREVLRSFQGVSGTPLSNSLKNQYAAAGVAITEVNRLGRLSVRHGVTTDPSNLRSREISIGRARDALVALVQNGTEEAGLIGSPITDITPLSLKSVVQGLLEHAQNSGTIVGYDGLAVRQRSTDPSVIEVRFAYRPAYPLNYIVIAFSINVATGETTDLAEVA